MTLLTVDAAMSKIVRLPALKPVVLIVLESFERPDLDVERIVRELGRDQSLSARVVRLANSSFYGLQHRVATLNEAALVLGFRHIRATVAAVAVTGCFTEGLVPGFDFQGFWRHSVAVSIAARALAERLGKPGDIAFLAGLLHDIGLLVLLSSFPEHAEEVLRYSQRERCLVIDAEHEVIGVDHALIGAALAERWKFPPAIRAAIGGHHSPDSHSADSLAAVVHLADVLVHAMGISDRLEELVPPVAPVTFARIGLGEDDLLAVMRKTGGEVDSLCQALGT